MQGMMLFWLMAYKVSEALFTLQELGVIDELNKAPADIQHLSQKLALKTKSLKAILNVFCKLDIIKELDGLYSLSEGCMNLKSMIELEYHLHKKFASSHSLKKILIEGQPNKALEKIHQDEEICSIYQNAMAGSMRLLALNIVRTIGNKNVKRVHDLGGADGALSEQLSKYWDTTEFIVIDLPPVRPYFYKRFDSHSEHDRFKFRSADLLSSESISGMVDFEAVDLFILSNVLHLFQSDEQINLLNDLSQMFQPHQTLLIYDQFVNDNHIFDGSIFLTFDWINYGADFFYSEFEYKKILLSLNFRHVDIFRHSILPGAIITASVE